MRWVKWTAAIAWWLFTVFVVVSYVRAWDPMSFPGIHGKVTWIQSLLIVIILGGAMTTTPFVLNALFKWLATKWKPTATIADEGGDFPSTETLLVGGWLVLFTVTDLAAVVWVLVPPSLFSTQVAAGGLGELVAPLLPTGGQRGELQNLLITMLAAGLGSSITAILGYLQHACIVCDFKRSYVPWYFARPLLGLLTGLIFYFVLKGGMLAVGASDGAQPLGGISELGLAALGALVGLFSKNALEKLREVFNTAFPTQRDYNDRLKEILPSEVWLQVKPYLGSDHQDIINRLKKSLPQGLFDQVKEHLESNTAGAARGAGTGDPNPGSVPR
jgi:hypothetical protein